MKHGIFITIEGPDGSGKTTGCDYLVEHLRQRGYDVVRTREPGGTYLSEEIRHLIVNYDGKEGVLPLTELLLLAAARHQHVETLIRPAVKSGQVVICDRFHDSSYAYQGMGRGLVEQVHQLETMVLKGFEPDYTLYFDVGMQTSLKRLAGRDESNRLDREELDFKRRVAEGYRQRFNKHPHRMHRIDAENSANGVRAQLAFWVERTLMVRHPAV